MQPVDFQSFISGDDNSVVVIDLDYTKQRLLKINEQLNPKGVNAIAIKTNPLISVLKELNNGITAFEAASMGEIALAKAAGVANDKIIFDSPVKTEAELSWLIENAKGAYINADSMSELIKMQHFPSEFSIGLRINPSVKINTIDSVNVSGGSSKFGELLTEISEEWIDMLSSMSRLDGLHVHQASQNNDFANTVAGIRKVVDLANALPPKKIKFINIGGGLAYDYQNSMDVDIDAYFELLKATCPELFNGKYLLITEFGRYYYAGGASVYSKVEHVKDIDNHRKMAIIHVGADMFLRESYNNKDWYHRLSVCNENFQQVNREKVFNYDIGGPLCFAGDIPFKNHDLPEIKEGDWLKIHDAGANTFSLWSRHCSRPFPLVLGLKNGELSVLKPRESLQDVLRFWGNERIS